MARKPDFKLGAMNKITGEKIKVGGGWQNDNGTIGIKLNPFVVLTAGTGLQLMLFPNDGLGPEDEGPQSLPF